MAKAPKKKDLPKKGAAKYEDIVQVLLSLNELIALSVSKKVEKKDKPKNSK